MTRADDRSVRLRDRLRVARESQGELFISLHADSLGRAHDVGRLGLHPVRAGLQR